MDTNPCRTWNVLNWNVRGINGRWKWDAVKDKIVQSSYDIVCLQETKKKSFDRQFLYNFCCGKTARNNMFSEALVFH